MFHDPELHDRPPHVLTALDLAPPPGQGAWSVPAREVELLTPVQGGLYHSPLQVILRKPPGSASLVVRLRNARGHTLAAYTVVGDGEYGFVSASLNFAVPPGLPQKAELTVSDVGRPKQKRVLLRLPLAIEAGPRTVNVTAPQAGSYSSEPIYVDGSALAYEGTVIVTAETPFGQRIGRCVACGGVFDTAGFTVELQLALHYPEVLVSVFAPTPSKYRTIDYTRIPVIVGPEAPT